jgi:hypothetical protein
VIDLLKTTLDVFVAISVSERNEIRKRVLEQPDVKSIVDHFLSDLRYDFVVIVGSADFGQSFGHINQIHEPHVFLDTAQSQGLAVFVFFSGAYPVTELAYTRSLDIALDALNVPTGEESVTQERGSQ